MEQISGDEILNYNHLDEPASGTKVVEFGKDIQSRGIAAGTIQEFDPSYYEPIVLLQTVWQDGSTSLGTGTIIERTGIATCGHTVYNWNTNKWAKQINIYFKNSNGSYTKKLVSAKYIVGEEFISE